MTACKSSAGELAGARIRDAALSVLSVHITSSSSSSAAAAAAAA